MNIKTLNVFYGGDFLPYKDKERQVHYPNVGSDFQGAENITSIRFYIDEISSNNTTFAVAIELPNGKIGSKVLSPAQYDSEIGEYYVTLAIDRFITQKVGNVSISLRGYQGDIELEYDDYSQLYVLVSGTPITAVTGSIKLRVNQEPQALQGDLDEEVTLQELLGLVATKLNVGDGIVILGDISTSNLSDYEVGQIFYDRDTHTYYEKTDTSPYYTKALSGAGVLGAPNIVCKNDDETRTIKQLNIIYSDMRVFSSSYLGKDFLCCTKSQGNNLYTFVAFDIENQTFYKKASVSGDTLPSSILVPANKIEIASKAFLASNYVPYTGANSNVHLNGHYLSGAKVYIDHNGENHDTYKEQDYKQIANIDLVLNQNTEIENNKISVEMYDYFLNENATLICRGLNYRKLTETPTDLIYACFNGSITPQTDGTSITLGKVVKISKTEVSQSHEYTESELTLDFYSKDQAKAKFGTSLALELNNTNFKLVAKLYNANDGLIDTSNEVDLPLESIVSSATYYDTYTYEGVTYTKVIVITLSTTSVPTIVPVGDLISGLEKEATIEVSSLETNLTDEQLTKAGYDNARIKYQNEYYFKSSEDNSTITFAYNQKVTSAVGNKTITEKNIVVTKDSGAMVLTTNATNFYDKDQVDSKNNELFGQINDNLLDKTNLVNEERIESGLFINWNNGDVSSNAEYRCLEDYIEIDENNSYCFTLFDKNNGIYYDDNFAILGAYYDNSKEYLGSIYIVTGTTTGATLSSGRYLLDVPSGTKFVRLSVKDNSHNMKWQLDMSQSGLPYHKYNEIKPILIENGGAMQGKIVVNFGDSIIGNTRDMTSVSSYIAEKTGALVYNCGFGGCQMSKHSGEWDLCSMYNLAKDIAQEDFSELETAIENGWSGMPGYFTNTMKVINAIDFSKVDYIVISYGTNDYREGHQVIENNANIFDNNFDEEGFINPSTGENASSPNYKRTSKYYPIKSVSSIYSILSELTDTFVCLFYDINGNYLYYSSHSSSSLTYTLAVPNGAVAFRVYVDASFDGEACISYEQSEVLEPYFDNNNVIDCLKYSVRTIQQKYPQIKILVTTPIYRMFLNTSNAVISNSDIQDFGGGTLRDYSKAYSKACDDLRVPCLDLYNISQLSENTKSLYYDNNDGTHPNQYGRKQIGYLIGSKLEEI